MKNSRIPFTSLVLALSVVACSESAPPAAGTSDSSSEGAAASSERTERSAPPPAEPAPPDAISKFLESAKADPDQANGKSVKLDGVFRGTTVNDHGDGKKLYVVSVSDDEKSLVRASCDGTTPPPEGLTQFAPITVEGTVKTGKAQQGDKTVVTVAIESCTVTKR